jgi:flagellar basal body rod protein FlgG
MIKGIYHAGRSLSNQTKNLERIANNLANINTIGFKREGLFIEFLKQEGGSEIRTPVDLRQGNFAQTGNPLNLAISGDGYFVLHFNGQYELTRNGNFAISENGFLVNQDGKKVMGKNGEISLLNYTISDEQVISINENGEIRIGDTIVDTILIANRDEKLNDFGILGLKYDDLTDLDLSIGEDSYQILQGYLEESNVNPIEEMELMIKVSKDYEASYKIVQSLDDTIQKANEIGKV